MLLLNIYEIYESLEKSKPLLSSSGGTKAPLNHYKNSIAFYQ